MKKKVVKKSIRNSRARYDYDLGEDLVAGLILSGAEVKSIRFGHVNLKGSFASMKDGELWLNNMSIHAMKTNAKDLPEEHRERARKLLVTRKQLEQLDRARASGLSIVPLQLLTEGRHIKVRLGIGRGKKKYDKRETIKKREQSIAAARALS